MCGRYSFFETDKLYERYDAAGALDFAPRYNISPGQKLPAVPSWGRILPMYWGLRFDWTGGKGRNFALINLRAETLAAKAFARKMLAESRCLVPANGFFEWAKDKSKKIPYYFKPREGGIFSFAGLYSRFTDKSTGEVSDRYAIVTVAATGAVKEIHDRMPLVLPAAAEKDWLHGGADAIGLLGRMGRGIAADFSAIPVGPAVNKAANDGPEIILPVK